ncbi:hypothetical protein [Flagellimonas eckloniae]|uniref:Uncharacterized protein n=1 Tax=Flagellimonas eckloniae TaxID=346185 RepID=A0A0Q1C256_9FLAO|nr:hypothetical protein [Allomuricauda eckloniae]KQC31319.1 hypothetical protein AAY42_16535 [Allomuricauda eckloniae]
MERRDFAQLSALASMGLLVPLQACRDKVNLEHQESGESIPFEALTFQLLTTWSNAMVDIQIDDPEKPEVHGALYCKACNRIHGRCMDAVYPFLYMADKTGAQKYLDAAINVMKWSENVSMPDGSWTVVPDPKSWRGITVFGAIALGEALHHHGHVLPKEISDDWTQRLQKAAKFIHENFTIDYSHINYAFTAIYGLNFLGRMFKNVAYINHSRQLADEVPNWLTKPNKLIFGENKPSDEPSAKGLLPVDLGYNVEETLNGLVQYAVLEKDEQLLQLLTESMNGHLEFMLPDGAWDNSWGTRQNKWSYWGSRTTDGCQPAFALMADRNPAFGTAAFLSTELLKRCTVNGLLAGGLHYESHDVKPCLHHTFAHAKSLAFIMDNTEKLSNISKKTALPRGKGDGIKHFPELDVWLAAKGPWRATVSSYDVIFKKPHSQAATGGSLAVLWHNEVGPIFTASMAEYILVERYNQQPQPNGEDFPLTPRIESNREGKWYSNLFDLKAKVKTNEKNNTLNFEVVTQLTDRERAILPDSNYQLNYSLSIEKTIIVAKKVNDAPLDKEASLVLPIISPQHEQVVQVSEKLIEIQKKEGTVLVMSSVPLLIVKTKKKRVFNMVPGMEAILVKAVFEKNTNEISCEITVR